MPRFCCSHQDRRIPPRGLELVPSNVKVAGVREAIESTGATQCFLPAYSPDVDPIEQVFAKLTNTQRKMAHPTVDALWEGNGSALDGFAPNECLN